MKVHELSFYSQFQCTMSGCPDTCCHGWQIVIDDETAAKYMAEPNLKGFRLRSSLTKQNGTVMFKGSKGKCPFLTKDRLCGIQLSLGEDYLSDVCRTFPRQRINYGFFAEELLFLSCPQACRLFLNNLDQLYYKTTDREVCYETYGTNDDAGYLQELLEIRLALTAQIMDTRLPRPMLYAGLTAYAKALQQSYISNYSLHNHTSHPDSGTSSGNADNMPAHPDPAAYFAKPAAPFFIPHDTTYAMLAASGFYHIFLKTVSPFLYSLCRLYLKKFHRLTPDKGNAQMRAMQDTLHADHPGADRILRGYLTYYLLEDFFITYEDYSFLRNIAIGIMHTHLLEIFLALFYEKNHRLTDDDLIQIISVYTRRGRHNETIEKNMYEKMKRILYD